MNADKTGRELLPTKEKGLPSSIVKEFWKAKRNKTFNYKGSERKYHGKVPLKLLKLKEYNESEQPFTESNAQSVSSSEKLRKIKEWWFAEHPPLVSETDVENSESSLNFKGALVPWNHRGSPLRCVQDLTPLKAVGKLLTCEKNKEASRGNSKHPAHDFESKSHYGRVPICVYDYSPPGYVAPQDVRSMKKSYEENHAYENHGFWWVAPLCTHDEESTRKCRSNDVYPHCK